MKVGNEIYNTLKKNNASVWGVIIFSTICVVSALFFSFYVWKESQSNIFGINEKGELVPLKKLEQSQADLVQAKANIDLFVNYYLNLTAYSMKSKQEKLLWLLGKQPTKIIKDRANKGYFDEFMSIAGLVQNAEILQQTLKITKEAPYKATFVVRIQRVNGGQIEEYNDYISLTMDRVNRNYPYNPYGLLITQLSENLKRVEKSEESKKELEESQEVVNQNPAK